MMHDLKQQAEHYRKHKQYTDALPLYEKLWEDQPDKWIGWGYAHCLRKTGYSAKALEICQQVYRLDNTFTNNNSLYGWCVYDVAIKPFDGMSDDTQFIKAVNAVTQLTVQEEFSPYERAVFAMVNYYEGFKDRQKPVPHIRVIEWLDRLNPHLLSCEPNQGADGKSYPSSREEWYASRAKALLGLQRYHECIDICTQALSTFRHFHYDYDIWFRKYRSECYLALHQESEAFSDLDYMIDRKPDAWIRHLYGLTLYGMGHLEEAITYAAQAALPHQRLGFRWEVYLDLGKMLAEKGELELARQHVLLAAAIRHEEGWEKIPTSLQDMVKRLNLSLDSLPPVKKTHRELESFWKSLKPRPKTTHNGAIIMIHANGKSGVVRSTQGHEHFFGVRSFKGEAEALCVGTKVQFNVRENINRNSGKSEMHAVDIYVDERG
jgi:tetratricopeptide (TPR) repeat protein